MFISIITLFVPLVALMALGAVAGRLPGRFKIDFTPERQQFVERLVYHTALPVGTFLAVSALPVGAVHYGGAMGTILVGAALLFAVAVFARGLLLKRYESDVALTAGVTAVSKNSIFLGLPVIDILVRHDLSAFGIGSIYVALSIPAMVTAVLLYLHLFGPRRSSIRSAVLNLATDPVFIAIIMGFGANLIRLQIPEPAAAVLRLLASMATPLILIVIGSRLRLRVAKGMVFPLLVAVVTSSFIGPAVAYLLAQHVFGLPSLHVLLLIVVFGMPVALASPAYLTNAGVKNLELNTATITATTALILVTMPLWRLLILGS